MYTTYHLSLAQEINADIVKVIKAAFKSKPITITVEETEEEFYLSGSVKTILDERLQEDETEYLTADASITQLKKKYAL